MACGFAQKACDRKSGYMAAGCAFNSVAQLKRGCPKILKVCSSTVTTDASGPFATETNVVESSE